MSAKRGPEPPPWPDGLDEWWALLLGLRAGTPAENFTAEVRPDELPAALAHAPGWTLAAEDDSLWLCSTFQFPVFKAAAVFTNFLFASIQMTTYPFANGLTFTSDAEAKVRISGPIRKALTCGVVLFASVLSNAFYLTCDKPQCRAGEGAS